MSKLDEIVVSTSSAKAKKAKETLNDFIVLINKRLLSYFDKELESVFGVSIKEKQLSTHILKHIKEHNLRPAKRLRGSFIYYAYKLFSNSNLEEVLDASLSIELIHTALLMHDDFMDQDDTRRGLPTTHEFYKNYHKSNNYRFNELHYGESMAVTTGDVALCLGFELLGNSKFNADRKNKALNQVLRGIANTAYGQAFDITLEAKGKASEKDIIDLHLAKTAIYTYENPLHIGAILAGATKKDLEVLSNYAIPGGIAFQLQDDILGLYGDAKKTGKPAHSDLRQGKMTLLIIKALELGNKNQVRRLKEIWGKRSLTEKEADEARKIVRDTRSHEYSKNTSVKWAKKAQKAIPDMKKMGWNINAIEYLDGIAQYMVEREV